MLAHSRLQINAHPVPFPFLLTVGTLLLSSVFPDWALSLQERNVLRKQQSSQKAELRELHLGVASYAFLEEHPGELGNTLVLGPH